MIAQPRLVEMHMQSLAAAILPGRRRHAARLIAAALVACTAVAPAIAATAQEPASASATALPAEVAGIAIPQTPLAQRAAAFVRQAEPDFLFNHSLRTFVFGALRLKARGLNYDAETAFVAAVFHDLGLMPQFASNGGSFEVDGASRAEAFVRENGGSEQQARVVWNAVAMHDLGSTFQNRQTSEALLLGAGAGSDVNGPDPAVLPPAIVTEVLQAFPRLHFKTRFTALAIDHCRRKPTSQIGWLDTLCREVAPADRGSVQDSIAAAPFAE